MFDFEKIKIGVFDSGIGGITVLKKLVSTLSGGEFYYLGDNGNAPYGEKSQIELLRLAVNGINKLVSYGVNVVVLGCNTLSLNVLNHLQRIFFNIKFFGVFPPIEKFAFNGENYLAFATQSSVKFLKEIYPKANAVGLPYLATDIENNANALSVIQLSKHISGVDTNCKNIILGCTHYSFIEDKFKNAFCNADIVSGTKFTVKAVVDFIKNIGLDHLSEFRKIVFIGDFADKNSRVFSDFYAKSEKI